MNTVANPLGRSRVEEGDQWVFRFGNGLVVHTDPFLRRATDRVLPLGGPQDTILNRMLRSAERVRGRRVFEPFAGAGAFGLMALKLGASRVEFLDINSRACAFQRDNATRNGFAADRYQCHLGSIIDYEAAAPFDLVLANPPFVPTPPGIPGTLTSNGGPEGSDLAKLLFLRLDGLLHQNGEAYVYVMQLVSNEGPLLAGWLLNVVPNRTIDFTPTQVAAIPFGEFVAAYHQCFPRHQAEIERWRADLSARHGERIGVEHYVMHVGPKRSGPSRWVTSLDLSETYGVEAYPVSQSRELALSRVMENVIPSET